MLSIDVRTPVKTWQGEGPYTGERIVLLRLMKCNLKCNWQGPNGSMLCDTAWTWDGSEKGKKYYSDDLAKLVIKKSKERLKPAKWEKKKWFGIKTDPAKIVMITGGEPMLQQNDYTFQWLVESLREAGLKIHVETNGTIALNEWAQKNIDFFDISPKVVLYPAAYTASKAKTYMDTKQRAWKFVVSMGSDVLQIRDFLGKCSIGFDEDIWLMPCTDSKKDMSRSLNAVKETGMVVGLELLGYKNIHISERRQVVEGFA